MKRVIKPVKAEDIKEANGAQCYDIPEFLRREAPATKKEEEIKSE